MKKLTIGMATFDDFDGVFFSIQSIRLANQDILDELDFVVLDNSPDSAEGKATKDFCQKSRVRYYATTDRRTTAIRSRIFNAAEAESVLVMDPHVLLEPNTIKRLIEYFEDNTTAQILHGPMLYDCISGHDPAAKMEPIWRDNMFGTWACDKRANDPDAPPFDIEMMGLGLFACRKDSWPGFHPLFKGFGGEEGYVHEKMRRKGGRVVCLPFLRWIHRFQRPRGAPYPLIIEDRVMNYLIGWLDLEKDPFDVVEHFKETHPRIPVEELLLPRAEEAMHLFEKDPATTIEKWHSNDKNPILFPKPETKLQEWNQTDVSLSSPLSIDVNGTTFQVRSFGLSWASD